MTATSVDPVEADAEELVAMARAHLGEHWSETFGADMLDEHAQSAYEQLLALHRRGEQIEHPKALIKKIAWRVAGKDAARRRPDLVDPNVLARKAIADRQGDPGRQVELRSEIVNAAVLVDQLTDSHQAVFRAQFIEKLTVRETARRLGTSKSSVQRTRAELRQHFDGVFSTSGEDATKVKILTAYSFGDSSVRKAAEALLKHDPTAGAIYRQLRGFHEGAAALVPPATLERAGEPGIAERLGGGFAALRERVAGHGGDATGMSEAATQLGASGVGRGSGAAAGGTFGTIAAAFGGKGIAACAGGAATAACVGALAGAGAGPLPALGDREKPEEPPAREQAAEVARPVELPQMNPEPAAEAAPRAESQPQGPSTEAAAETPPPQTTTTAPTVTEEACNPYDPGCAPSPTPSSANAPAPVDSASTGGGGTSARSDGGGSACGPYDPAC